MIEGVFLNWAVLGFLGTLLKESENVLGPCLP